MITRLKHRKINKIAFYFYFRVLKHKKTVTSTVVISVLMILAYNLDGAHQEVIKILFK